MLTRLRREALEVHFDPLHRRVPDRTMREGIEIERAAQLAIDADEQVAVERRRHAERIVVGQQQVALGLDEVRAEQQEVAGTERGADVAG